MAPGSPVPTAVPETVTLAAPPCELPEAETEQWFHREVRAHESMLKHWLRRKFPSLRDIDDLVHDAYIRLWKRHRRRRIESSKSFLFTVARNLAINNLRRHDISPISDVGDFETLEVIADGPMGAELACRREETELLLEAIDQLSPRTREVFLLRKFEQLSYADISLRLKISLATIEHHISRANKRCEKFLRDRGVIPDDDV